jgi:hypothetical protein
MMFDWVHGNLTEDIYVPLSAWTLSICHVLRWSEATPFEYRENIFLYRLAKFMSYIYKNRAIVGDDVFFTTNTKGNYYLYLLSSSILKDIMEILQFPYTEENMSSVNKEKNLMSIEFLSKLGECINYTEFILILDGKNVVSTVLRNEVSILKDSLIEKNVFSSNEDCVKYYKDSINSFFGSDFESSQKRIKLFTLCYLFNDLLSYELYKIYDSWYDERKKWLYRLSICKFIKNVVIYRKYKTYNSLIKENNNLYRKCKGLVSNNSDILNSLMPIHFLYTIKAKMMLRIAINKRPYLLRKSASNSEEIKNLEKKLNEIDSQICLKKLLNNNKKILYKLKVTSDYNATFNIPIQSPKLLKNHNFVDEILYYIKR